MKKNIILAFSVLVIGSLAFAQTQTFPDVNPNDWFHKYIEEIKDWGIINGQGDGTFAPEKGINRAEFSKIISLYDQRINEKIEVKNSEISNIESKKSSTVMYLQSYDKEIPNTCPENWTEADYRNTWRNPNKDFILTRTCYIENECSIMELKSYDSETPNTCPENWIEADLKITDRSEVGTKRQYTRTCYICQ